VRYYVAFGESCLKNGSGVTDKDRFDEVFGDLEQLVDINALFTYLVDRVGCKQFVDPLTKEDPMLNLVSFFSKPEIKAIQKLSEVGTTFLNDHDVSSYVYNHIENSNALLTIANLRIGGPLIQKLKDYQAEKKRLPLSFSTENIRRVYLAVRDKDMSDTM